MNNMKAEVSLSLSLSLAVYHILQAAVINKNNNKNETSAVPSVHSLHLNIDEQNITRRIMDWLFLVKDACVPLVLYGDRFSCFTSFYIQWQSVLLW